MQTDPLVCRISARFRLPIAAVALLAIGLVTGNLFYGAVTDRVMIGAAIVVAVPAGGLFLCGIFDRRFQSAVSALNAQRRFQARKLGRISRLTGLGLPIGDPLLAGVAAVLIVMLIAAHNYHRLPPTELLFASFALVGMAQIALMAQGYLATRFFDIPD